MSEPLIGGKYSVLREIGRGAMGVVWEALDTNLRRKVALKQMTFDHVSFTSARRRFEREARIIAHLRNQHIVQVYDYGVESERSYIVMELLLGEDLHARLKREKQLSPARTLALLREIAAGLEAASAAGVVHRDLKPANIFLARSEMGEVAKILDFGLVWVFTMAADDESELPSGAVVGTPSYMSPEQVRAAVPDHRSDLWSLGVLLYEALTGRTPFQAVSLEELIISICADPFPPASSVAPDLPSSFDRFFDRALAKDRAQRFQSAREMVAAFAAACEAGGRRSKILVVDDEPDVQRMISQRFRKRIRESAYEFVFAVNGQDALDKLAEHADVDVILTDIQMPVMDGLTLLQRVGEMGSAVQTVIVSAYSDMINIRSAMNRGAFDFLVKPVDLADLETTLAKTLKHVEDLRKGARSDQENGVLRQYVSAAVTERLRSFGPSFAIASESIEATVAFISIWRFTAFSQSRSPGDAIRALNANFEVIVPEVTSRGGVIHKILGDAVMAVFYGPDHAPRAVDACKTVRAQVQALAQRTGADSPYANGLSIGVATGRMICGGVGSRACGRLAYVLLGDAVDTAAHLARAAGQEEILVDNAVREGAGEQFYFAEAGTRHVDPRSEPISVFCASSARAEGRALEGVSFDSTLTC